MINHVISRFRFLVQRVEMGALLCALFLAPAGVCFAAGFENIPLPSPPSDKVFRIAYLEAVSYHDYDVMFQKIREQLDVLGWGNAIVFPEELHYSLKSGEDSDKEKPDIGDVLARGGGDLMLSFGTDATQRILAVNPGTFPIVGASMTDAFAANIVSSRTDSGADNFTTALGSTDAFMIKAFHQLVGFKKLGIIYSDTTFGRIFAHVNEATEATRENGIELISYPHLGAPYTETVDDCLTGVKYLQSMGADAILFGDLRCLDLNAGDPSPIYDFLSSKRIPVLVADNKVQVKHFAAIGMSSYSHDETANFHAHQIIHILSGVKPRDLPLIVPFNFRLQVNLESMRQNGITLKLETLLRADEIYLRCLRGGK
ncbi:hypothetical protein FACS189497_00550 [Betaproteobacteria bacterium]|nr:hypothetical protein AGMMS50225_15020 [Betaproteobacteria bacterium]GHU25104.1 hypothetical protein FACS189488_11270 [Betaproteobacteria bacterium]GHU27411.1 hypothetical protein FACS189497_00550 [Betaproteobacteria bacterium]